VNGAFDAAGPCWANMAKLEAGVFAGGMAIYKT
jgi:hypothetical protein